jgi:hypothetical protein
MVTPTSPSSRTMPLPVPQLLVEPLLDLPERAGHHAQLTDAVDEDRVLHVRQPLGPLPLVLGPAGGDHRDEHVVGGVEGDQLGDQRPGQAPGQLPVTGQADRREPADGDLDGQVGHD